MSNSCDVSNRALLDWMSALAYGDNPFKWVTNEQLAQAYTFAYTCYLKQHYAEARHIFHLLAVVRPAEAKYWKGMGACFQMEQDYAKAIDCYLSARIANIEENDPYLYLYTADCYFAMQERESALKALESAHILAKTTQDQRVLQHVKFMQSLWSTAS